MSSISGDPPSLPQKFSHAPTPPVAAIPRERSFTSRTRALTAEHVTEGLFCTCGPEEPHSSRKVHIDSSDPKIGSEPGRRQQPATGCAVGFPVRAELAGCAGDQFAGRGVDGLEGDSPAEALEAADVAAGEAAGVGPLLVVAEAEVGVGRGRA